MKKTCSLALALLLILTLFLPVVSAENEPFTFREDGTFTVLHLTDSQDDHHPSFDMLNLVRRSIAESDPDLIVFTGDIVEDRRIGDIANDSQSGREGVCVYDIKGDIVYDKTLANIRTAVDALFSVLEESGVPYVITQGNNDHKCGITNEDWLAIYAQYPHCFVTDLSDDAEGRIDYNRLIYGKDGEAKFNLWFTDTGKGGINADQLEWYRQTSRGITEANGGEAIPAILFQHIHTADIGNLFTECRMGDDGATAIGAKFYRLDPETAHGNNFYAYEPGAVTEQFKAWKECGDVIGAFFGHQHVEGFSGLVDGIELGFTYGCEFAKTGPYGYRVITLHEEDPANYDNDLYVYEGSVLLGTDKITKQIDEPYPEYDSNFLRILARIRNFFLSFFSMITALFG